VSNDGFDEFYRRTYRRLVVELFAVVGSLAEAEDLVQEAFARASVRWPQIRDYDMPEAWVRRVALNMASNALRRADRAARALARLGQEPAAGEPDSLAGLTLVQALGRLSQRHREVLVLHYLAELPVEQVGATLGVPASTVKGRLSRARTALTQPWPTSASWSATMPDRELVQLFRSLQGSVQELAEPPDAAAIRRRGRDHAQRVRTTAVLGVATLVALLVSIGQGVLTPGPQPDVAPLDGARPPVTPTTAPVATGVTRATRAYVLEGYWAGESVRPGSPDRLPVTKSVTDRETSDTSAALVFPLLPKRPDCLEQVELRLHLRGGSGERATIAAYPSSLLSLAEGRRPGALNGGTLLDNRPKGEADVPLSAQWAVFDITRLYTTWVKGGPFPSMGRTVPQGRPLVLIVRPPSYDDPGFGGSPNFERVFDAPGGDRANSPQLRWTGRPDC
jgi:RNA polymerase sigma-70 factor, ECF subfamily